MTINQAVYNYIKPLIPSSLTGFYYLENNNQSVAPYGTIYQIDDPKVKTSFCATDEGQTRFQIDIFDNDHARGIDLREQMYEIAEGINPSVISDITIYNAIISNVTDRANTVNGLFQFSFEIVISWQK